MGGLGPGIGGFEYLVIGIVALVVVGPERLPGLLRQLGKMVAKARGMANEFRSSFEDMARQSELDELRKEVEALRSNTGVVALGAEADAAFKDIKSELGTPAGSAAAPAAAWTPPPLEGPPVETTTAAASEWPDGEPVMMPIAPPPLIAPAVEAVPVAAPKSTRRKAAVPAEDGAPAKARKPRTAAVASKAAAKPRAARNSKLDL